MIEYVLLFALGFLAAALVALIVAPVIQRRVVILTERRIRASVPLSAAEIRAEKDMAKAAFAAENARLSVDLKQNRDQLTQSTARSARLSEDLVALRAEKLATEQTLEERDAMVRDLNAQRHERDIHITTLTADLHTAIRLAEARKHEIAMRDDRINHLGAEIEELRIDLVTLDTEAENFKSQIRELRDERRALREALQGTETTNRDLEARLKREEDRVAATEEKLAATVTALTDRENALERRVAEVERFKQKNRDLSSELRTAKREIKDVAKTVAAEVRAASSAANGATAPDRARPPAPTLPAVASAGRTAQRPNQIETRQGGPDAPPVDQPIPEDEKIDRLRARQAALIERLLKADTSGNDAALRREVAIVAAMMVELTAGRDGAASPIHKILKGSEEPTRPPNAEPSLATRARDMIAAPR